VDPATNSRLREGAAAVGVTLDEAMVAKLGRYLELLQKWNRRINLTALEDPVEVVERHFVDSLALVPLLEGVSTLVDIGSGGGFPGAVVALARPPLRVTAVDSIRKKVAFLETLRIALAPNLEPVTGRHDDLIRAGRTFDAAVSRATWDPAEWVREGAPLVRPGGLLFAMQSADQDTPPAPPGFRSEVPLVYPMQSERRRIQPFRRVD
jgi:16S rRNA (guanine527-N7)-methyltransferase